MRQLKRRHLLIGGTAAAAWTPTILRADSRYDPGVSDREIKLGNTMPYSGPASAYGVTGKAVAAYWTMVNDQGGINGRKVTFISYDDAYSPPKTVEMVRKLVEEDRVFAIFMLLGTAPNTAARRYLNGKKVPQLFVASGDSKFGDHAQYPWTMGWQPNYVTEGGVYAKHILANHRDGKIGILWQNDDSGKDYTRGFMKALGKNNEKMVVASVSYEISDPTIETHIIQLKSAGATVFVNLATPKAAAQAIRKAAEIGWKPAQYLAVISASIAAVLKPAGLDNSKDIVTAAFLKDPTDNEWANAPDFIAWKAWMAKYLPDANPAEYYNVYAYAGAATMHHCLTRCGDLLTRANLMKQAVSMRDVAIPLVLPGITLNTSPTDFYPIQSVRLQRFNGESWQQFGAVIHGDD
ncbi:ABC transporter substrate-binding protein [Reyranella sp. CPCC 100927]|uniref:ABC transporter substrate-binding protein n=1 Tax=Reyranella sp. CPCC 100927 TaxID=2599616 RepID=UPI0011B36562|nr:ABC transporter substrate-binding protein [Reyranella sp. CPCC 100927]TWT13604.1 ABC transporter substrate-binding protein [Reyranella sp. CPCC 100927]